MKGFIQRLALLIHWIGFILGVLLTLVVIWISLLGGFWSFLLGFLVAPMFGILPHLCGWVISWIITGNKQFLPFKYSSAKAVWGYVKATWDNWRS
jgi:hypothetical protein